MKVIENILLWRSHFNSECQNLCSGMLKTKAIIDIFWTQFFLFSFISELKTDI